MKLGVRRTGLYHYNVFVKRFFTWRKIGTANISLDGRRINLNTNPKWWKYARDIGEFVEKEYLLQQANEQSS